MPCVSCIRDFHEECAAPVDSLPCCCPVVLSGTDIHTVLDTGAPVSQQTTITNEGISLQSEKAAENVRDPQSTGRKRAAKLYPIDNTKPCEWQRLGNVGGGKYPIVGCLAGKQRVRHHGPDKNTLNNREGNVHRICDPCHTRWHAQNDADYDPSRGHKPHLATAEELMIWNIEKSYEKRNRGPGWEHLVAEQSRAESVQSNTGTDATGHRTSNESDVPSNFADSRASRAYYQNDDEWEDEEDGD